MDVYVADSDNRSPDPQIPNLSVGGIITLGIEGGAVGKAIVAPKEIRTRYTEFEAEHIDSHTSNAEGGT